MKRFMLVLLVALFALIAFPGMSVYAYPPCGAYEEPSAPDHFCRPYFYLTWVVVDAGISTASLRVEPSLQAQVLVTLSHNTLLRLFNDGKSSWLGTPTWDGHQWWWHVQLAPQTVGWIEQRALADFPLVWGTNNHQLPKPCSQNPPNVYLALNGQRRHIVDWQTFMDLGYQQSDISACENVYYSNAEGPNKITAANFPEGAPITRLVKGSGSSVYWMENGIRRHIPNMATFTALGFQTRDITVLPDEILNLWPEGTPLPHKEP
jgi:hypothetical protein